jgi:hypothetical protein
MRDVTLRRRHCLRRRTGGEAVEATVATILLVVITVALTAVVGFWLFAMAKAPAVTPDISVTFSRTGNRWSVPVTQVSDELPLAHYKMIVRHPDGSIARYDTDGDGVADKMLATTLDKLVTGSADGLQGSPIVFVDANANGKLDPTDSFVAYSPFFYPGTAMMDATRGYKTVGTGVLRLPLASSLQFVGSETTLGSSDIHPNDTAKVEIRQNGTHLWSVVGKVSGNSVWSGTLYVPINWTVGPYVAKFVVRPGAGDEWQVSYSFDTGAASALTPAQRAAYDAQTRPIGEGDVVTIIYTPYNDVVIEFTL